MVTRLSGDSDSVVLISGSVSEYLRVATAFGTSMLPFLKPGAKLRLEPVEAGVVRLGDIITFRIYPEVLITHRVVKIMQRDCSFSFFTKGDNRLICDPQVSFGYQIIGRVIGVDRTNIRSLWWRVLGRMIAWISYRQSVFHQDLVKSPLNRFRHTMVKKGWFPIKFDTDGKLRLAGRCLIVNYSPYKYCLPVRVSSKEREHLRRVMRIKKIAKSSLFPVPLVTR